MYDAKKMEKWIKKIDSLSKNQPEKYHDTIFERVFDFYCNDCISNVVDGPGDLEFAFLDDIEEEMPNIVETADKCPEKYRVKALSSLLTHFLTELIILNDMDEMYDEEEFDDDYDDEDIDDEEDIEDDEDDD